MTTTVADRMTPRATKGLRLQLYIAIVMIVIEIALGIDVNLFAKLPAADKGTSLFTAFGAAVGSGPLSLTLHAIVGTLILLAGISVIIRAVSTRRVSQIVLAAIGLLAVIAAWGAGTGFVGDQADGASLSMALTASVSLLAYSTALFLAPSVAPASLAS